MADLDEFTDEELATLGECFGSGNGTEEAMRNSPAPRRVLSFGRFPWRRLTRLWGEYKSYGQEVTACGVAPGESHDDEEDVFLVTLRKETRVRKWYKVATAGGASSLHSTLTWEQTFSSAPPGLRTLLDEGGAALPVVSCEESAEGEMPEHWEGGYEEAGYYFTYSDEPVEYLDESVITGEEAATAAVSGEVLLATSAWSPRISFGRRWVEGGSLVFADFTTYRFAGAARRMECSFALGGRLLPCTLKWQEVRILNGEVEEVHDRSADLAGDGTINVDFDYPPYGWRYNIQNMKVVPV